MHRSVFQALPLSGLIAFVGACGADATVNPQATAPSAQAPTTSTPAATLPSNAATAGAAAVGASAAPAAQTTLPPSAAAVSNGLPASAAQPPAAAASAQPTAAPAVAAPSAPTAPEHKLAMDECGLHTKFAGDQYCILPPAPDKGFQLHIGPSNYDNPEAQYVLQPGEENVVNMTATSGNDKDVMYYYRQYRMRPGSHHVILTANGKSIGGTQNLARDNPDFGIIPPENEDVGLPLPAKAKINANMHFYNFSDKPMIRELWVNYWYKSPEQVKEAATRIFSMTGVSAAVAHSHVVVGASCSISGTGRVLSLSGHRHLNNVRFSVWHKSGGKKDLVFEDFDSEHPGELEYNSLAMNPMVNTMSKAMGGVSGILNVKAGDTLDFECEIVNNTNKNFFGANEAQDDEMCILTGDAVGATVSAGCSALPSRKVE